VAGLFFSSSAAQAYIRTPGAWSTFGDGLPLLTPRQAPGVPVSLARQTLATNLPGGSAQVDRLDESVAQKSKLLPCTLTTVAGLRDEIPLEFLDAHYEVEAVPPGRKLRIGFLRFQLWRQNTQKSVVSVAMHSRSFLKPALLKMSDAAQQTLVRCLA
jgi:hypothetical protein